MGPRDSRSGWDIVAFLVRHGHDKAYNCSFHLRSKQDLAKAESIFHK